MSSLHHHSVSVKVTSVAFQLPTTQQEEEQDAQAYGGSSIKVLGKRSRDEEALQRESAIKRKYLWVSNHRDEHFLFQMTLV